MHKYIHGRERAKPDAVSPSQKGSRRTKEEERRKKKEGRRKNKKTEQEQEGKEEIYLFPNKIKGRGSGITILLLWYFISMEYNRKANNKS